MSSEGLRFTLSVAGIVEMATAVVSFRLYQHHCTPFILDVDIASGLSDLTAEDFLEKNAVLTVWQGDTAQRYVSGIVTEVQLGENNDWQMRYSLSISPPLWRAGLSPFNSDDAVWHFHPVVFLDAINSKSVCACNRDITLDELKKVAPAVSEGLLKRYLYDINAGFIRFGMTTCREKAHFLAQIIHESGYFRYTKEINGESASYSPWYGRGLIQVTGESNYTAYGEYINEDVTSSDSARDKLISSPHCVLSAFWYFNIFKRINEDAKNDDFNKITAVINGGYNHYDERLSIFNKLVTSLAAKHLNQKEINDDFLFDDSGVYDNKVYALGWGIWHDPDSSRRGTIKSNEEALKGYRRAKELIDLHPFPQEGREGDRKVYGIEKRNISTFVERRITELE